MVHYRCACVLFFIRTEIVRASPIGNVILPHYTISKNYFINYTIPFYNTLNIPKLYYFTILLKYYFLIFLYYFFPIVFSFLFFKFNSYSNNYIFNRTFASCQRSYFQHIQIQILPTVTFSTYIDPHTYIFNNHIYFQQPANYYYYYLLFIIFFEKELANFKIHLHIYSIKSAKF